MFTAILSATLRRAYASDGHLSKALDRSVEQTGAQGHAARGGAIGADPADS